MEPVSTVFNLIPVYHLLCTYDWSIFAVYVKHVNRDFKIQQGDGNENVKKGLISKTITSRVHRTFLYISLPFLHYCDVEMPIVSRFMENVNIQRRDVIYLSRLGYGPLELKSGGFACI